jgi:hypothetical protein
VSRVSPQRSVAMTDAELAKVLGISEDAVKRLDPAKRVPRTIRTGGGVARVAYVASRVSHD